MRAVDTICSSAFESSLFRVSFSLAFFWALRIGELVSPSGVKVDGLMEADVSLSAGSVRLKIRRSKIESFGCRVWILLQQVEGGACPDATVADYLHHW